MQVNKVRGIPLRFVVSSLLCVLSLGGCATPTHPTGAVAVDTAGDTSVDTAADGATDAAAADRVCSACAIDADCGGSLRCLILADGTRCLAPCTSNDDCSNGLRCYAVGKQGSFCTPPNHSCAACQFTGCPDGQDCQTATGSCTHSQPTCATCSNDIDCTDADVCRTAGGQRLCRPRCSPSSPCPEGDTCIPESTTSGWCMHGAYQCCAGKSWCASVTKTVCEHCSGLCLGGQCRDCLADSDCAAPARCNLQSWLCEQCPPVDAPHKRFWSEDKHTCVACLQDSDCGDPQADYRCLGNVCTVGDPCAVCAGSYPACAQVNEQWSCVECVSDADCAGKGSEACNPITYTCPSVDIVDWPTGCQSNSECPPHPAGLFNLSCDLTSGLCLDAEGLCDNVSAYCLNGQSCHWKGVTNGYEYGSCEAPVP